MLDETLDEVRGRMRDGPLARKSRGTVVGTVVTKSAAESGDRLSLGTGHQSLQSGRPDSNRRRPAWEAGILPTELRPQEGRKTRKTRRQRAIELHAGDGEDLAVAESGVNCSLFPPHLEKTNTSAPSVNEIVGRVSVATTESPVEPFRMTTVFPLTVYVPVLPELSATVPELVVREL